MPCCHDGQRTFGQLYNVLVTLHGLLMMFFVVIPARFGGFGNSCAPDPRGARPGVSASQRDMSYWLFIGRVVLALLSGLAGAGIGRAGALLAQLSRREPDLFPDAHGRRGQHAAALYRLSQRLCWLERADLDRLLTGASPWSESGRVRLHAHGGAAGQRTKRLRGGATTLEWSLPTPPPYHTFQTLPRVL